MLGGCCPAGRKQGYVLYCHKGSTDICTIFGGIRPFDRNVGNIRQMTSDSMIGVWRFFEHWQCI
jgi:hypothetical protein